MSNCPRKSRRWRWGAASTAALLTLAALGASVRTVQSYPKYRSATGPSCAGCHGAFTSGTSPKGTLFPFDNNHLMHRASSEMNTSCDLCHYEGDQLNPDLNRSDGDGFGGGPGFGCLGCHGRDYGPGLGVLGVGLREVHRTSGVSSCGASSCHTDDPDPLPEHVPPPYYGSFETRAWDVCNRAPTFGENFSLDTDNTRGLDNDGDGLYDEADDDCASCVGDLDADGSIGFSDLLIVLSEWGPCPGCAGDVDLDGAVGFSDLLAILASWGPCF